MEEIIKKILVVEDEPSLLEAINIKLTKSGFEVITARSVMQARNQVENIKDINVIWLDHYLLGKEDGLDFITWCKAEGTSYKSIPIFVVSNTASPDKIQIYLRLGAEKYYVKAEKRLDNIISDIKAYLNDINHN